MFLVFRTESWPDTLEQAAPEKRTLELEPSEISHARARRLPEGAKIHVGDGQGRRWRGHLHWRGKKQAFVTLEGACEKQARPVVLDLMAAVPRGGRNDWLVEKSTELGLRRLIPAEFERSVRERISADRFHRLAHEAAAQSESWYLPTLENRVSASDLESFLERELSRGMHVHILDLPDENMRNPDLDAREGEARLNTTGAGQKKTGPIAPRSKSEPEQLIAPRSEPELEQSSAPSGANQASGRSESNQLDSPPGLNASNVEAELLIVVGPEGGFGPRDQEIWDSLCGKWPDRCKRVYLGSMVLRVETAAIAYLAYQRISRVSKDRI